MDIQVTASWLEDQYGHELLEEEFFDNFDHIQESNNFEQRITKVTSALHCLQFHVKHAFFFLFKSLLSGSQPSTSLTWLLKGKAMQLCELHVL